MSYSMEQDVGLGRITSDSASPIAADQARFTVCTSGKIA